MRFIKIELMYKDKVQGSYIEKFGNVSISALWSLFFDEISSTFTFIIPPCDPANTLQYILCRVVFPGI